MSKLVQSKQDAINELVKLVPVMGTKFSPEELNELKEQAYEELTTSGKLKNTQVLDLIDVFWEEAIKFSLANKKATA